MVQERKIPAHRVVLASASHFFNLMFTSTSSIIELLLKSHNLVSCPERQRSRELVELFLNLFWLCCILIFLHCLSCVVNLGQPKWWSVEPCRGTFAEGGLLHFPLCSFLRAFLSCRVSVGSVLTEGYLLQKVWFFLVSRFPQCVSLTSWQIA